MSKTTENHHHHHHSRICVMGLRGVGKTSFVRSALSGSNDPKGSKDDSLEDSYVVEYASNNGCIVGEVVDTRGDLHTLMKKQFFKLLSHSDGFVLVFSIDNDDSFQYLKELCNDIQSYAYGNVPILIVCNKCDLEENRQVTTKVLSHLVDHIGCKLLNTSSNHIESHENKAALMELLKDVEEFKERYQTTDVAEMNQDKALYTWILGAGSNTNAVTIFDSEKASQDAKKRGESCVLS